MKKWIASTVLILAGMGGGSTQVSAVESSPQPAPAFWHVGIVVADLATMDRFYGDVIGLKREPRLLVEDAQAASGAEGAIVVDHLDRLMTIKGTRIEIRHYSDPLHQNFLELLRYPDQPAESVQHGTNRPLGLNHLGISVAAIDPIIASMKQSGLGELVSGPQVLNEFGGLRFAFLKDPEGNLVELMEVGKAQAK